MAGIVTLHQEARLRLRHPRRGVLRIEVMRGRQLRLARWLLAGGLGVIGGLVYSHVFLLLPVVCLLFAGNPCLEVSRGRLTYGTSFGGWFLAEETVPLRGLREVRVEELRYRQWGIYRGPEDDPNAEGRGRNLSAPYLVLDEGVTHLKLPLGLSNEDYEWLADYLESFTQA